MPLRGKGQSGSFHRQSGHAWLEQNKDGRFSFRVVKVEPVAIHLRKSDGANLMLDLHAKVVRFNGHPMYRISKVHGKVKPKAPSVTGHNVASVSYRGIRDHRAGRFERIDDKRWRERTMKAVNHFTVTGRSGTQLHLQKSDGARLVLDLAQKKVKLNGHDLYNITSSKAGAPAARPKPRNASARRPHKAAPAVTGHNCTRVNYTGHGKVKSGYFQKVNAHTWHEANSEGRGSLTVAGVSSTSVRLRKSNGAIVAIDLRSKKITYNGGPLYRISSTSAKPIAQPRQRTPRRSLKRRR